MGMSNVRWLMVALLTGLSLTSYVERINLTVVARFIRDEFHLTNTQIGWSFTAFLVGYALAQAPAGALVDRFGPRRVLSGAALAWFLATLALGFLVGRVAATSFQVIISLVATRLFLGVVEAPTYPGAASTVARWFGPDHRGVPNGIVQSTAYAGEALTLALMAGITAYLGWRSALFASAVPALLLAGAWWWLGADDPANDRRVSPAELALIRGEPGKGGETPKSRQGLRRLRGWPVVCLSLSYCGHGYVAYLFFFWFYIYLVDARHFSIAAGGLVGALPAAAAAICAFAGGPLSNALAAKFGRVRARQLIVFTGGLVAALAILVSCSTGRAWLAIFGFVVAIGTRGLVESAFWSSVNDVGEADSGLVGGVMNALGNVGGILSTLLAPVLVARFGWNLAIASAAVAAALSGWLILGVSQARGLTADQDTRAY